jgi:hypothetical protein
MARAGVRPMEPGDARQQLQNEIARKKACDDRIRTRVEERFGAAIDKARETIQRGGEI